MSRDTLLTVTGYLMLLTAMVAGFFLGYGVALKRSQPSPYATDFRLSVRVTDGRTIPLSYSDAKTRDEAYERMKHLGPDQFYEGGQEKEWCVFIRGYAIVSVEKVYP